MPTYECQSCNGTGTIQVPKTDEKGKTIYVTEDCKGCRGSGVIQRNDLATATGAGAATAAAAVPVPVVPRRPTERRTHDVHAGRQSCSGWRFGQDLQGL